MSDEDNNPPGETIPAPATAGMTAEQITALVDKSVQGLQAKNTELLGKLDKTNTKLKTYEQFGDTDKLKSMMERIDNDEESKLLAEGKFDELLTRRTERMEASYQQQIEQLANANSDVNNKYSELSNRYQSSLLNSSIDQAASSVGIVPEAMESARDIVRKTFKTNEAGEITPLDANGNVVYGSDGKNPVTIGEFVNGLKSTHRFLFPQSQGSGATGSGNSVDFNTQLEKAASNDFNSFRKMREKQMKSAGTR